MCVWIKICASVWGCSLRFTLFTSYYVVMHLKPCCGVI